MNGYKNARRYLRKLVPHGFLYAHVEPTNACNTTCRMCPRHAMARAHHMMTWGVFERICEVFLPSPTPMLSIVGFGEPTLHRRLPEMIEYAKQARPDLAVKLTTNGTKLTSALTNRLCEAGLDFLEVSVVGCGPKEYAHWMGGLSFCDLLRGLDALRNAGQRFAITTFSTNKRSPSAIRNYWRRHGVENVLIKGFHHRGGYLGGHDEELGEESDYEEVGSDICHKLHLFCHINARGFIVPCVQEINNQNILGHIDGATYSELLRMIRSTEPSFNICSGCEIRRQNALEYYARFLGTYFEDRLGIWEHRLHRFRVGD